MPKDRIRCVILALLLGVFLLGQAACEPVSNDASDNASPDAPADAPRLVSLTPAITQMLIDMGKRDRIVGVSKEDADELGLPVCGSFNNPVIAKIVELNPDVVLTESPMGRLSGVPPLLRSLADEGVFELRVIPHSQSIAAVERALTDAEVGLGAAVGDRDAAEKARRLMALRIELVRAALAGATPPKVLMLINPTTLGAIGTNVTHDELLGLAGGVNALAHLDTGYLTLDRASLQQNLRPEVVLILEPGGVALRKDDPRLRAMEGLAIPAVTKQRIVVIKHPQAMLPSTTLPEVLVEIAIALHPDRADRIREAYDAAEVVLQKTSRDGVGS